MFVAYETVHSVLGGNAGQIEVQATTQTDAAAIISGECASERTAKIGQYLPLPLLSEQRRYCVARHPSVTL